MAGIDYWDEEAVCCGHNVPVAQLLIDGWAKGEDEVISALDRYTYESGDRFIGETLLHLRRIHKKPMYRGAPSSSANLPETSNMEGVTLKHFRKKSPNAQKALLKKAVKRLQGEYDNNGNALFANKQDWIGVYLLVKSQLKMHFTQKDFPDYAKKLGDGVKNNEVDFFISSSVPFIVALAYITIPLIINTIGNTTFIIINI